MQHDDLCSYCKMITTANLVNIHPLIFNFFFPCDENFKISSLSNFQNTWHSIVNYNHHTLATSWEDLIHWKRLWCWEGLRAGGEGDDRGWDGWMASPTGWTWVWVNSGSWWWTGRPGVQQFMGSQRIGHDWATEWNWTECFKTWNILDFQWDIISRYFL